jgi:hypothetical protein
MKQSLALFIFLTTGFYLLSVPSAEQPGQVLYVNNQDATCSDRYPCFTRIQAAIDAAQPRDTVQIQAGTYPEQLFVEKNNFPAATEADRIVIQADPSLAPDSVRVTGSPGPQCTDKFAIRFKQSKFITIRGLTITQTGAQAIFLMGGNNGNQGIHIERNRIFGNGSRSCNGGITIARGNPDTLIANNLIYANGRNGIAFIDADGGPHYIVNNTVYGNQWNGVSVSRSHEVFVVDNIIIQNGTLSGSTGGRYGVQRENSSNPQPQGIHLFNNLLCGNRLGEIDGPILDAMDANNLTPSGNEGPGVMESPGCEVASNVLANVQGADSLPYTADDKFDLAPASPAIDGGLDPRTLGLGVLFDAIFEADYLTELTRPRIGIRGGSPAFDMGASELIVPNQAPVATASAPGAVTSGTAFNLNGGSSFDPDGDSLAFQWSQIAGPAVTLSDSTSETPSATAPIVSEPTFLTFQLVVSDGLANSTAAVTVAVLKPNEPPVLAPIGDKTVSVESILTFTLSGSDPDNDPLVYSVSPQPLPSNASFNSSTRVFSFTPSASQAGSFSLTFSVSDGRGGTASETITITVAAGVTINIDSPAAGANVAAGQLLVRGTVQAGDDEAGVTVNGAPAGVQGNTFMALVFVTPNDNSLVAIATTGHGATATQTLGISVTGSPDSALLLDASPDSGIAPLAVTFSLFSDVEISHVSLDADGDGIVDISGTTLDQYSFVYAANGAYLVTATATDAQGNQFTAKAVIHVFDRAALDASLRAKWAEFRAALARNDIEGALTVVANGEKDKYRQVFQKLAPDLPVIAASLRELVPGLFQESIMEYATTRDRDGQTFVHFVYFMQDEDGVWKIVTM